MRVLGSLTVTGVFATQLLDGSFNELKSKNPECSSPEESSVEFSNLLKFHKNPLDYDSYTMSLTRNLLKHAKLIVRPPILNVLWIAEQTLIVKEAVHVISLLAWRFVHVTLSFGLNLIIACFSNLNKRIKNQISESATTAVHVQKLHCIVKHVS